MAFFVLFFSGSLLSSLVVISSIISPVLAATLAPDEVTALKVVAEKLGPGKTVWNFSGDPCNGWSSTNKSEENAIWCDCDNTYHLSCNKNVIFLSSLFSFFSFACPCSLAIISAQGKFCLILSGMSLI